MLNLNDAPEQAVFDLIPENTLVIVQAKIQPGDAGEGGLLTRSKTGAEMLVLKLKVAEGVHLGRVLWENMVTAGPTDGHAQAADIALGKLRAILESARGIQPADLSEAAKAARIASYEDFDGIRFMARLGVEPARDGYKAKNFVATVVTPDMRDWRPIEQVAAATATSSQPTGAPTGTTPIERPKWAQ